MFEPLLTRGDHKARMNARLYAGDLNTAMRSAKRLGAADAAIVRARIAVKHKAKNAGALLDAVPKAARQDPAYLFTRIQWLRRNDQIREAAELMLQAPHDPQLIQDADAWWTERRILVRKLLDAGKARTAYRIARDAALPSKESLRVDQPFTAGWIALRFLRDTSQRNGISLASRKSRRIQRRLPAPATGSGAPLKLPASGDEARRYYQEAAQRSAAYYGQMAGARLGQPRHCLRRPPAVDRMQRAAVHNPTWCAQLNCFTRPATGIW